MSLIQTCRLSGADRFDYVTAERIAVPVIRRSETLCAL